MLISSITYLFLALLSYYLHDTLQLWLAAHLKYRLNGKLADFPADAVSYLNLQRLFLTFSFNVGWSSEHNFLYEHAGQFKHGRLSVVLIHLISPFIYIGLALIFYWLAYGLMMLNPNLMAKIPILMEKLLLLFSINLRMAALMFLPIPPLSFGLALTSYYSADKHQYKRRQIYFYGTLALAALLIMQGVIKEEILPVSEVEKYLYLVLNKIGLV